MLYKVYLLLSMVFFLCSCRQLPHFGIPIEAKVEKPIDWYNNLPEEYIVKHISSISFGKNNESDIIAYLMIKGEDFRLLGMNELGLTLFDIYSKNNQPLVIVKSFPELEKYDVLKHMARDIRLTFMSSQILKKQKLQLFSEDKNNVYVCENSGNWSLWKFKKGRPFKIREGYFDDTIREIEYILENKNIPQEIAISYPNLGVRIQLEVLEIEAKTLEDAKFIPKEL